MKNDNISTIGVDSDRNVWKFYKEESIFLGKIRFFEGHGFFYPSKPTGFPSEALIAISNIILQLSENPSDEQINELFNDKS